MPLTRKQRYNRARQHYISGQNQILNKMFKDALKTEHGFGITKEIMLEAIETGWNEAGDFQNIWNYELEELQKRIEKEYRVWIDHDEDIVHIHTWK